MQDEVYRATTRGLIEGLISGYNATVFAYGPTGSSPVAASFRLRWSLAVSRVCVCVSGCGKTYTMLGTDKEPGIYVRTLNDLFHAIEETSDDMLYSVSMSYLEVRATHASRDEARLCQPHIRYRFTSYWT